MRSPSGMTIDQTVNYQIVHSHAFDIEYDPLVERYKRLDEIVGACCWALTRDPHTFTCIDNTQSLWAMRTADDMWGEIPQFDIGYQIIESPRQVILLTIEVVSVW